MKLELRSGGVPKLEPPEPAFKIERPSWSGGPRQIVDLPPRTLDGLSKAIITRFFQFFQEGRRKGAKRIGEGAKRSSQSPAWEPAFKRVLG